MVTTSQRFLIYAIKLSAVLPVILFWLWYPLGVLDATAQDKAKVPVSTPISMQWPAPVGEKFQGRFLAEAPAGYDAQKHSPIASALVFVADDGQKYAILPDFYFSISLRRTYELTGMVAQRHLPAKAKDDDYRNLVRTVWPDSESDAIKQTAKTIREWMKKNPDTPLLVLSALERSGRTKSREALGKIEKTDEPPLLIKQVDPVYPAAAMRQRLVGVVVMDIVVDEDGNVEQIRARSEHPLLTEAAIKAVAQNKYLPMRVNGQPLAVRADFMVKFGIMNKK